ncbi:MAG: hypothetical protein ACOYXC_15405 [Candidatus Rifleibacteriota bacterium]
MANNQKDNRRLIFGAVFLLILLSANFLVRIGRKPTIQGTPANTSVNIDDSVPKPDLEVCAIESDGTVELQLENLKSRMAEIKAELDSIPLPLPIPDLSATLFLARKDLFEIKIPAKTLVQTDIASESSVVSIATPTPPLELIASFKTGSKRKLMIKQNNQVYLINDDEKADFTLVSVAEDKYTVLDNAGKEHELDLKKPDNTGVEKALEILKNTGNQTVYSILTNASETENLQNSP